MSFKITESQIQKSILDWLHLQKDCFAFRTNNIGVPLKNGGFRPSPVKGLTDILCCYKGRFIAIEVKRPGGKLSENQSGFLVKIEESGGVTGVVYSVEDLEKLWSQINC